MNGHKSKSLRKELRSRNVPISAEPYYMLNNGQVVSSVGRQIYQRAKEL